MLLSNKLRERDMEVRLQKVQYDISMLYEQRNTPTKRSLKSAGSHQIGSSLSGTLTYSPQPAVVTYEKLQQAWKLYDIKIPSFSSLERRLNRANQIVEQIASSNVEVATQATVLLVPPTKILPFPVPAKMRVLQNSKPDTIHPNLAVRTPSHRRWRVFLVYGAKHGLYLGTPKSILQNEQYMIAGFDTRQMGLAEYAALTLQSPVKIDDGSWTVLLHDTDKNSQDALLPCARLVDEHYIFELEEAESVFGSDRFRPAIEVV